MKDKKGGERVAGWVTKECADALFDWAMELKIDRAVLVSALLEGAGARYGVVVAVDLVAARKAFGLVERMMLEVESRFGLGRK